MLSLEVIEALTNDVEFINLAGNFGVKLVPLATKEDNVL